MALPYDCFVHTKLHTSGHTVHDNSPRHGFYILWLHTVVGY